jgi:hypothetical protein
MKRCTTCNTQNIFDAQCCDRCGVAFSMANQWSNRANARDLKAQATFYGGQIAESGTQYGKQAMRLGAQYGRQAYQQAKKTSSHAVLCLGFAIGGWSYLPILGAILAIVFGRKAKEEIKASQGSMGGENFVTIGLTIAFVELGLIIGGILLTIFLIILRGAAPEILRKLLEIFFGS